MGIEVLSGSGFVVVVRGWEFVSEHRLTNSKALPYFGAHQFNLGGNVGRLVALLRDQRTVSLDITEWTND